MTAGPDDLDDLDVLGELDDGKELGEADELEDLDDEDDEDELEHREDEVSLDARPFKADDSILAQDEMLELFSDDADALGTEIGGFGPDRPTDATIPGLYQLDEIDDVRPDGDVYDDDLTGPDREDGPG